jgi:hypothetical protein
MGFRIGLLYTRFASMPQALWAALRKDGHHVIRPEDLQIRTPVSTEDMIHFARLAAPDVIFVPVPEAGCAAGGMRAHDHLGPAPGHPGRPRSVLAVLGDPHRSAGVGVDDGPRRADDQARGAPFCWRRCCVRPVGV